MKRYWQTLAARIDDLPLRSRAMLFATISLVLVTLAYVALLEPLLARQKTLIERSSRDHSQLAAVRGQIANVLKEQKAGLQDPEEAKLLELEARIAAGEKTLARRREAFVAPSRLPALLRDLLPPGQGVRMESLRVVPGAQAESGTGLYRHGVEMTLKGSYAGLTAYLAALEKLPARLLWGRAEFQVERYPDIRLTLQVHTLSTRPTLGL